MKKLSSRWIVKNGLLIAMVFLATYFTHIPTPLPGGYFNLGDAVIMTAAITMGRTTGFLAGSIGSALADIAYGSFIFAPITFVVKGIEGLVTGSIATKSKKMKVISGTRALAVVLGAVTMVAGYFVAEAYILGFVDSTFGLAAAFAELLPNSLQGFASAVSAYLLSTILKKSKASDLLLQVY